MTTKIEWVARPETTPESWNPVGSCTPVSEGCRNCWAARLAATRLKHHPRYEGLTEWVDGVPRWTGEIRLDYEELNAPLHWREPRTVFVCSMSDLLHKDVPLRFILSVYNMAEDAPQHTYLWLTKRPDKLLEFHREYIQEEWLRNIWPGVTVENADQLWRIQELLKVPAAVYFVSLEPLLGPINLCLEQHPPCTHPGCYAHISHPCENCGRRMGRLPIDWVIVGGDSGPNARPMHPDWARSIRDQCQAAGVPFFMKQMSQRKPIPDDLMIRRWPNVTER